MLTHFGLADKKIRFLIPKEHGNSYASNLAFDKIRRAYSLQLIYVPFYLQNSAKSSFDHYYGPRFLLIALNINVADKMEAPSPLLHHANVILS